MLARAGNAVLWARHVAEHLGEPLAAVLAWPPALLEAEIARAIAAQARDRATACLRADPPSPPPAGDDLISQATRAIYARMDAARQAAEEEAADAMLETMMRQGAR